MSLVDNKKFRALIFDFDGLLVNTEIIWEKVEHDILHLYGAVFDPIIMSKYIGTGLVEWSDAMVQEYQLTVPAATFRTTLMEMILPEMELSAEPMPGAEATIVAAKAWGGPIAIASSSNSDLVNTVTRKLGWDTLIPVRCTGDQVARAKPAPDVFLLAAERLGVAPSDCLVLEDSINGARAAHAAGMTCIAVPNPNYSPTHFDGVAAYTVPSLNQLDIRALLA